MTRWPYARRVTATPIGQDEQVPDPPTPEEITTDTVRLLTEVNTVLSTDRWAILDTRTDHVKWLLYNAASLRHCCKLLGEIEVAALGEQELTVRVLGRTHLEAWLAALYLHFGGNEALTRIAQDTRDQLEKTDREIQQFDQWLADEKRSARRRLERVRAANEGIRRWNAANPDEPQKPLLDEPHIPRLSATGLDLRDRLADFDPYEAQSLSVSELVDRLTKLAPKKGFGQESFRPIYLIYRFLSMGASHPTLHVFDSYLIPPLKPGSFVRIAPTPLGFSQINATRVTALYGTAYLASHVLGSAGCATSVAGELQVRLEPDPSQGAGWFPGYRRKSAKTTPVDS